MIARLAAEPGLATVARRWVSLGLVMAWVETLLEIQHAVTALPLVWVGIASAVYTTAVGRWAYGKRYGALAGLVAFGLLAFMVWIQNMPGERHGKYLPALVLLVSCLSDLIGRPERAIESASGVVAAAYVSAGISKLVLGGRAWVAPGALSMLVIERAVTAPEPLRTLRHFVGTSPYLGSALAMLALVAELGAIGWVVPRWRRVMAVVCCAMHLGIALLLGFIYLEWMCVLVGLGLASARAPDPVRDIAPA